MNRKSHSFKHGSHGRCNVRRLPLLLVTLMASIVGLSQAAAADKNWAGPSPGTTLSPESGEWDTSSLFWNTGSGSGNAAFTSGSDVAIFGGADGNYGIRCNTALTATTIRFNNSGYALTNDAAISLTSSLSTALVVASGKTATVGTNVTVRITANGANYNPGVTASGELIIENGGAVQQPNSFGLQIDGAPGSIIRVKTGGQLRHTGNGSALRVGQTASSSPVVSVEGGLVQLTGGNTGCVIGNASGSTGTVSVASGVFDVANNVVQIGNSGARGTVDLNGGSLYTRQVKKANAAGVSIFNFNGGTLKASSSAFASTFLIGIDTANVRDGGAIIDNNAFSITVGQLLAHSAIGGDAVTDGGLVVTNSGNGGSLTLTNANTYNGPTLVRGGARLNTTTRSVGGGDYTVADGGTLEVQVVDSGAQLAVGDLTLGSAGNLTNLFTLGANASTTDAAVTASGTLNLNGTVYVTVTGTGLTGATYLLVDYTTDGAGSGSFVLASAPTVFGYTASLVHDTVNKQVKLVYTAVPPVKWAVGNGAWNTTTPNWALIADDSVATYTEGAFAQFDDSSSGASPITVTLDAARSPSAVSADSSKDYVLAGNFDITGSSLTKDGDGTLVLNNGSGNSFSPITITDGTLQLGNNSTGGSLGGAAIANAGTLAFDRTDDVTVGNAISGGGAVVQNGGGTVTLSTANTHSGLTTINSGRLVLANTSAAQNSTVSNNVAGGLGFSGITSATLGGLSGTGDVVMTNAAGAAVTLTVGGNNADTELGGALTGFGTGTFNKAGTGTLALSGTVSALHNLAVSAGPGTLTVTNGTVTATNLQVNVAGGVFSMSGGAVNVITDGRIQAANGMWDISGGVCNFNKIVIANGSSVVNALVTVSGNAVVNQDQTDSGNIQRQLWVGGNNGGSGSLLLKDNAAWIISQTLLDDLNANPIVVVGNANSGATFGQGTFTIQDNAAFSYANRMRVGRSAGNIGTVNLNGGTVSVTGIERQAGTATVNVNGGTLQSLGDQSNFFNNFTGTGGDNNNSVNLLAGGLTFDTGSFTVTLGNVLSGDGGLTKEGDGTLNLNGANTYTGATLVNDGTLGGNGTIAGDLTVASGATLSPGTSIGTLTIEGTPTLAGTLVAELDRNNAQTADNVVFNGGVTFGGTLTVVDIGGGLADGDVFDLFDGTLAGAFDTLNLPGGPGHWNTADLNSGGTLAFNNVSPSATNFTLGVNVGGSNTCNVIGKFAGAIDADGDSVVVSAVTQGANGIVTFNDTSVTYTSTNSESSDSFTYTVSDGLGGTDTKTVTVVISSPEGFNQLGIATLGGDVELTYLGIPGQDYALEWTHSLTPPITWEAIVTNAAAGNGYLIFTNTPSGGNDFYRTVHVP